MGMAGKCIRSEDERKRERKRKEGREREESKAKRSATHPAAFFYFTYIYFCIDLNFCTLRIWILASFFLSLFGSISMWCGDPWSIEGGSTQ